MKKSRFTESQIVAILKEGEAGVAVSQITRKHGISAATYYHWKSKYAGAGVPELKRLRELEVRTRSSSGCTRTWRWRTPQSRTFSAENSDAVGQARGDPDHDCGARSADRPSLPGSPAVAGGVLQAGAGLGRTRSRGHCGAAG